MAEGKQKRGRKEGKKQHRTFLLLLLTDLEKIKFVGKLVNTLLQLPANNICVVQIGNKLEPF